MFGSTYSKSDLSPERYEEVTGIKVTGSTLDPTKGQKILEDLKRSEHAAMVLKSLSESASDAAKSAGRASYMSQMYKKLENEAKNRHAALATEFSAKMDQLARETNRLKSGTVPGVPDIQESAAEGYEKSMTDENYNLPEVTVKSDFGKYLLIGGGVLLAIYLLRGKKKNA